MDAGEYIQMLIDGMTIEERARLLSTPFDRLWESLWNGQNIRQYRHEFDIAKRAFENLKNTGDIEGRLLVHYIERASTRWEEPEWGLPKGRRALREPERACAVREFNEETGMSTRLLHLVDTECEIEEYVGTNGTPYKQVYYIGGCSADAEVGSTPFNRVMAREVRSVGWFPYEAAIGKIRPTNPHKLSLFARLHARITTPAMRAALSAAIEWHTA